MKYVDEFRNKDLVKKALDRIKTIAPGENLNIMEVCGTHTQSFFRFGLDKALPENLKLIAGPGCPVCVSTQGYIDNAIRLAQQKDVIILTFGDMLRVPGTKSSLEKEKAKSSDVRVVYSALDCLKIAKLHPEKKIIFLAVGFETTAPTIALSILTAKKENLHNLLFFSSLKTIPAAMSFLLADKRLNIGAFLCPGHVSAIIGTKAYAFVAEKYRIPCCVAGFEPLDILEGIYFILRQNLHGISRVDNQYIRVVTRSGNIKAQQIIKRVFLAQGTTWRGLGEIPGSGLGIRKEFSQFDAEKVFKLSTLNSRLPTRCRCGDILKGLITPLDCPLFAKTCCPDNPIGPCMVSQEGACNAYYKYHR